MARTILTVHEGLPEGIPLTGNMTAGTVDGHAFANQGSSVILVVSNSDNTFSRLVTVPTKITLTESELAVEDATYDIPFFGSIVMGPFWNDYFMNPDGYVYIDFEAGQESDFSVFAYRVPRISK